MASYGKTGYDVEYSAPIATDEKHRSVIVPDESGAVHGESFVVGDTLYAKIQRLAGRFGVEQRGIERVPEDERTDKTTIKLATMVRPLPCPSGLSFAWESANGCLDSGSRRT